MHKERFKIIPAVYVLLEKDGKVLFMRRYNTGYRDGQYTLPSGHLDGGETLLDAAIRETKEELDIDLSAEDMELVHVINRPKSADHERVDFFFKAEKWSGEPRIAEPNKCDNLLWLDLSNLNKEPLVEFVEQVLELVNKKVLYSQTHLG